MTDIRNVLDLEVGNVFTHRPYGDEFMVVRVEGAVQTSTIQGFTGADHRVVLIPVTVLESSGVIEAATETTLTYTPEAEVVLTQAPTTRHYDIGIPVCVTVTGDGKVTLNFDLSEVSDLDEDDYAYGRYGDDAVAADAAIVSAATATIRNTHTITL